MSSGHLNTVHILLVEDNKADAELVRLALKEAATPSELHVVVDGVEAIKYLKNQAPYEGAGRPAFVLLDLNLPRKTGGEALAEIKSDPELKTIPVVIFTSSNAEKDIMKTYYDNANCYVTKPVDFREFKRVVKAVADFWSTVATLPGKGNLK